MVSRQDPLGNQIAMLRALDLGALRDRWVEHFGIIPSCRISKDLLIRGVTYRLQEAACGALNKSTRRRLARLAEELTARGSIRGTPAGAFKTGTKLVRVWKGEVHEVTIRDDGYVWAGRRYGSLSEVARLITGTRWSGPRFFGMEVSQQMAKPRQPTFGTAAPISGRRSQSAGGANNG